MEPHSVFTSTSKTDEKPREIDAKLPLDIVPRFFALFQKYIFGLAPNPAGASTHPSFCMLACVLCSKAQLG